MVRVISDKKFNPPRSRHSSGETVDKELAARTGKVLASLKCRRYELSDCDSFSDSHWDSETDVHNCSADNDGSEHDIRSEKIVRLSNTDATRSRKDRRRERNKLSAQAYRKRRREQSAKQQTVLDRLQQEHNRLKSQVCSLEDLRDKFQLMVRKNKSVVVSSCPPSSSCFIDWSAESLADQVINGTSSALEQRQCDLASSSLYWSKDSNYSVSQVGLLPCLDEEPMFERLGKSCAHFTPVLPAINNLMTAPPSPTLSGSSSSASTSTTPTSLGSFSFPASPVELLFPASPLSFNSNDSVHHQHNNIVARPVSNRGHLSPRRFFTSLPQPNLSSLIQPIPRHLENLHIKNVSRSTLASTLTIL